MNLSILFSIRFRQAATSALSSISVWIFFSVFYSLVINLIVNATAPSEDAGVQNPIHYQNVISFLQRLSPSYLFSEATTTLLNPSVRSLGPLTMEQTVGAIPSPLPLGQSLLLIWPQVTAMTALTLICFAVGYVAFMHQEIRSR